MELSFELDGRPVRLEVSPLRRVVDLLREDLGHTGTKEGCGTGECGACSVLVDGELRLGCLMLAGQLEGRRVTTVEGLAASELGRAVLDAFVEKGAVQCGYCTPGMEIAAAELLSRAPRPTRDDVRAALSGNLCRCTGYVKIVDAVVEASRELECGRTARPEAATATSPGSTAPATAAAPGTHAT